MDTATISSAKTQLPQLFRELISFQRLTVTVKHGTRQPALYVHILPDALFQALLDQVAIPVQATYTADDSAPEGWWTLDQATLGVYGDGATLDAALEALTEAAVTRARALARELALRDAEVSRGEMAVMLRLLLAEQGGGPAAVRTLLEEALAPMAIVVTGDGDKRVAVAKLKSSH